MALREQGLFLYGYQITRFNSSIDFRVASSGPVLQATLRFGYYSLSSLMREIARALMQTDPDHEYVVSADRNISAGLENRVTIATTNGVYLDLLFQTGPRAASSVRNLIGFLPLDRTGALTYTGNFTSGTVLIPTYPAYNYLSPVHFRKAFGTKNVSASGKKEAIVFSVQKFIQVQFKFEPASRLESDWLPWVDWAIKQKLFEFTPEISSPETFYEVTLERTSEDGNGMAQKWTEQLTQFVDHFDTGLLVFRQNEA